MPNDILPSVWPMIVAVAIGCVLLAVVLAWPWAFGGESELRQVEHAERAPADAVEPASELDMDDLRFLAWWTRSGC